MPECGVVGCLIDKGADHPRAGQSAAPIETEESETQIPEKSPSEIIAAESASTVEQQPVELPDCQKKRKSPDRLRF
ncbi:hypothetical protein scyTo_0008358 [Scyliorhinus torazame]|uniref:Uncharacterized protein n=1 Tax=Scyliorhinus torazame TaxID=75743 RepID=A0A401P839_SCYTO|nr:hypothetical protein [Scyliorhinus torazame]